MRAFEIHLNGKPLCVAGVVGDGVLTAIVDHVSGQGGNELRLSVGGLISATEEHVIWRNLQLRLSDEVTLKIIEAGSVDRPKKRYRTDSKRDEKNSKAYIRALAGKYGWKLVTRARKSK